MRKRRIPEAKVAITKNRDESKAVAEALDLLKINKEINARDIVVITANWVSAMQPETADVVGNVTLKGIIEYVRSCNPVRIVVAAGSGGGDTLTVMKKIGYDKIIEETQAEFVDLNEGPFTEIKINHRKPASTKLNRLIDEMTFHISFTQLKIHEEATMSASIKNMALSWPPSTEHGAPKKDTGIHDDLHGFIAEMTRHIPIDLSIVSASPAMVGTGPHNGFAIHSDMVICGTDPVAADTIGARLLGFKPQAVHYLYTLMNDKAGETDTDRIEMPGIPLAEAEKYFSESVFKTREVVVDRACNKSS